MAENDQNPYSHLHSFDAELIRKSAEEAGEIALGYFKASNTVWYKEGNSPVSEADHAVDQFLKDRFADERPDYGWLSEETEDDKQRLSATRTVIVDPIDGTRGFIDGRQEWCICIAIIEDNRPVEAVIFCPALGRLFQATINAGALLNGKPIHTRTESDVIRATGSKNINRALTDLNRKEIEVVDFVPSLAYRIAMVANGELDAAFARSGAKEWDLAAADLLLQEAGGRLTDRVGATRRYNQTIVRAPALVAAPNPRHEEFLEFAETSGILG